MDASKNPSHRASSWRIDLLGQVRATSGDLVITQFGSRKIAALLARLAMFPQRLHAREELIDLLWPEADLTTGRSRLRQALFALRRLLEPPGAAPALLVNRDSVQFSPLACTCDVLDFEAALRSRDMASASALYGGELMPGHYDEWVLEERQRLAVLAESLSHTDREKPPAESPLSELPQPIVLRKPARQILLPSHVARFFGREEELQQLSDWLKDSRLVTLLGPGGSGKTRLATELAWRESEHYAVVVFVALAECSQPDELPARIRAALRLPDAQGNATAQIEFYLQALPCLLVLDNFEQLVASGAAHLLEQLLQALPELQIVVTSRRVLDVDGERGFEVACLPLPSNDLSLIDCAANPSVALFVDRARAVRAGFHLNARNRDDVSALCTALDGIPLAIELAASRAHAVAVSEMRAQMHAQKDRRFAALARTGPRAARAPRHASLDAAMDWSWQLLSPRDQHCLAALSVFREGFTADAAATLWQATDQHEVLGRLIADSLVVAEPAPANAPTQEGALRYRLLEMVREFGHDRLTPADHLLMRARHRDWFMAFANCNASMLPLAEVPNLHQALRSSLEDGFAVQTLALSLATESHWERRGVPPEIRALWLAALDVVKPIATDLNEAAAAQVQAARCLFAKRLFETGDAVTAVALADQAVADARSHPTWMATALAVQLRLRWKLAPTADTGVSEALLEALSFANPATHARPRAELLNLLAESLVLGRKDAEAAMPYYEQALALFEKLGDARQAWDVRMGQGICAQTQGRYGDAIAIHTEVAAAAQRLDDQLLLVDAYNNLAVACNHAHRWNDAVHYGRQQLRLATRQFSSYMQVMALWNLARPLARSHQSEAAAVAMAASTNAWVTQYGALVARDERYMAKVKRLVRCQIGAQRTSALWKEGESQPLAHAVNAALKGAALPD